MNKKLIVTDIDGTLISCQFKILDSTKKKFARLMKEGHTVAIASAMVITMLQCLKQQVSE